VLLDLLRQEPEEFLGPVEHPDQGAPHMAMGIDEGIQFPEPGIVGLDAATAACSHTAHHPVS